MKNFPTEFDFDFTTKYKGGTVKVFCEAVFMEESPRYDSYWQANLTEAYWTFDMENSFTETDEELQGLMEEEMNEHLKEMEDS